MYEILGNTNCKSCGKCGKFRNGRKCANCEAQKTANKF